MLCCRKTSAITLFIIRPLSDFGQAPGMNVKPYAIFSSSAIGFVDKRNAGRCQIGAPAMIIGVMT